MDDKFHVNVLWCLESVLLHRKKSLSSALLALYQEISTAYESLENPNDSSNKQLLHNLLTSGLVYLLCAENVLGETPPTVQCYINSRKCSSQQTHTILLRWLVNKNMKILSEHVTPQNLSSKDPFKPEAHQWLIESLIEAHLKLVSLEQFVQTISLLNPEFDLKKEYPYDLEDAVLLWINTACYVFECVAQRVPELKEIESSPEINDLWTGLSDGRILAKVLLLYMPEEPLLKRKSICFNGELTLEDKINNWIHISNACREMNITVAFSPEIAASAKDVAFKSNLLVFLCDLFDALIYGTYDDDDEEDSMTESMEEQIEKFRQSGQISRTSLNNLVPVSSVDFGTGLSKMQQETNAKRNLFNELDNVSDSKAFQSSFMISDEDSHEHTTPTKENSSINDISLSSNIIHPLPRDIHSATSRYTSSVDNSILEGEQNKLIVKHSYLNQSQNDQALHQDEDTNVTKTTSPMITQNFIQNRTLIDDDKELRESLLRSRENLMFNNPLDDSLVLMGSVANFSALKTNPDVYQSSIEVQKSIPTLEQEDTKLDPIEVSNGDVQPAQHEVQIQEPKEIDPSLKDIDNQCTNNSISVVQEQESNIETKSLEISVKEQSLKEIRKNMKQSEQEAEYHQPEDEIVHSETVESPVHEQNEITPQTEVDEKDNTHKENTNIEEPQDDKSTETSYVQEPSNLKVETNSSQQKIYIPPLFDQISLLNKNNDQRPLTCRGNIESDRSDKKFEKVTHVSQIIKECQEEVQKLERPITSRGELKDEWKDPQKISSSSKDRSSSDLDLQKQLEEKNRENQLLRLKLMEQERMIKKERALLKQRLEEECMRIRQETIKMFIQNSAQLKQQSKTEVEKKEGVSQTDGSVILKQPLVHNIEASNQNTQHQPKTAETSKGEKEIFTGKCAFEIPREDDTPRSTVQEQRKQKLQQLRNKKIKEEQARKDAIKQRKDDRKTHTPETDKIVRNMITTKRSNKQLIKNALCHVCLAGRVNEREKENVVRALSSTDSEQFIILVRDDKSPVFKALYHINHANTFVKIIGKGPRLLNDPNMIKAFLRYDSGGKKFLPISTKQFGVTTDAVVLNSLIVKRLTKRKIKKST